jgi:hypothetical protein
MVDQRLLLKIGLQVFRPSVKKNTLKVSIRIHFKHMNVELIVQCFR